MKLRQQLGLKKVFLRKTLAGFEIQTVIRSNERAFYRI